MVSCLVTNVMLQQVSYRQSETLEFLRTVGLDSLQACLWLSVNLPYLIRGYPQRIGSNSAGSRILAMITSLHR